MNSTRSNHMIDDVYTNIELYGIYHPKNFHSFQPTWQIFFNKECDVCHKTIFPLMQACVCLRCHVFTHRSCTHAQKSCNYFTFIKPITHDEVQHHTPSNSSTLPAQSTQQSPSRKISNERTSSLDSDSNPTNHIASTLSFDIDSVFNLKLEKVFEKACMIPTVLGYLPEPRSQYCIWRSIIRAIAMGYTNQQGFNQLKNGSFSLLDDSLDENTLNHNASPSNNPNRSNNSNDSSTINRTFTCSSQSCKEDFISVPPINIFDQKHERIIHYLTIIENFASQVAFTCHMVYTSLTFQHIDEYIKHAHECLNTIICAFVSSIDDDLNAIIYDEFTDQREPLYHVIVYAIEKYLLLRDAGIMYEKIFTQFHKFAQLFALINPNVKQDEEEGEDGASPSNKQEDESIEMVPFSHLVITDEEYMELNVLIESLKRKVTVKDKLQVIISILNQLSYQDKEKNKRLDTDELMEKFVLLIYQQHQDGHIDWIAQCFYLFSSITDKNTINNCGIEAYALVTLQQCIQPRLILKDNREFELMKRTNPHLNIWDYAMGFINFEENK